MNTLFLFDDKQHDFFMLLTIETPRVAPLTTRNGPVWFASGFGVSQVAIDREPKVCTYVLNEHYMVYRQNI